MKPKKATQCLPVYLPSEICDRLATVARRVKKTEGKTRQEFVRNAIVKEIERRETDMILAQSKARI